MWFHLSISLRVCMHKKYSMSKILHYHYFFNLLKVVSFQFTFFRSNDRRKKWERNVEAYHDQFCLVFCTKMHYILTVVSTNLPYFPFKRLCKNLTAACPFDVILIQRIMLDLTNIILLVYYTTCNILFS